MWSVLDAEVARSWQAAAIAVAGGVLVIASAVAFTYLGVTQTNRHKPGLVRMEHEHGLGDVFVGDPAAAARFGRPWAPVTRCPRRSMAHWLLAAMKDLSDRADGIVCFGRWLIVVNLDGRY